MNRVRPFIRRGDVVLDIGCGDGEMLRGFAGLMQHGVGIDPGLQDAVEGEGYELRPGNLAEAVADGEHFDLITMLAVLEHLPEEELAEVAQRCADHLKAGGRLVLTVPSPRVDAILHVLMRLRLIDGLAVHEHHGFAADLTLTVFSPPAFTLVLHRRFQLGLNNLFVFERAGGQAQLSGPQKPMP